jgi:hypothetical protein
VQNHTHCFQSKKSHELFPVISTPKPINYTSESYINKGAMSLPINFVENISIYTSVHVCVVVNYIIIISTWSSQAHM